MIYIIVLMIAVAAFSAAAIYNIVKKYDFVDEKVFEELAEVLEN